MLRACFEMHDAVGALALAIAGEGAGQCMRAGIC